MGGSGSGGSRYGRRTQVEECRSLDVNRFNREGMLREGQTWSGTWSWWKEDGERVASLGLVATAESVRLVYTVSWRHGSREPERLDYRVPVVWTPCNYGGKRPWLLCPNTRCGRRVAKLYLPLYAHDTHYLCRHCYGLSYGSRSWDPSIRWCQRAWRVSGRLGGKPGLCNGFPEKPQGMHWRTYRRLEREYDDATTLSLILAASRFDKSFAAKIGHLARTGL